MSSLREKYMYHADGLFNPNGSENDLCVSFYHYLNFFSKAIAISEKV